MVIRRDRLAWLLLSVNIVVIFTGGVEKNKFVVPKVVAEFCPVLAPEHVSVSALSEDVKLLDSSFYGLKVSLSHWTRDLAQITTDMFCSGKQNKKKIEKQLAIFVLLVFLLASCGLCVSFGQRAFNFSGWPLVVRLTVVVIIFFAVQFSVLCILLLVFP